MDEIINLLEELNNTVISIKQYDKILESGFITDVDILGIRDEIRILYNVKAVNGKTYNIYL